MLYILLSLIPVALYFLTRSSKKKDLVVGMNVSFAVLCAISFHEKAYYLAIVILFQMALINKLLPSYIINLKPLDDKTRGKRKLIPIVSYVIFTACILLISSVLYTPVAKMNISLSFSGHDIYKLLIIFFSFLLVFITRKEVKK